MANVIECNWTEGGSSDSKFLNIRNKGDDLAHYTVMTKNPQGYVVKGNSGYIQSRNVVAVEVSLTSREYHRYMESDF